MAEKTNLRECNTVVEVLGYLLENFDNIYIEVKPGKGRPRQTLPLSAVEDQEAVYDFVMRFLRGWHEKRGQ
jgi:hypothetical protein